MNRRDAISRVAILMGGTIFGAELFLSGCKSSDPATAKFALDADQISLLNEIGETILPQTTASGGAKAANVGQFMQVMVRDCYSPEEQKVFLEGIDQLNKTSKETQGKEFMKCNAQERHNLLLKLDKLTNVPYFAMIKQLTLLGYFTSEIGYKAMGYVAVPRYYKGDVRLA